MSRWRNGAVFIAVVLSQSCWLFLTGAILGAISQRGEPLLPWLSVLGLLLASSVLAQNLALSPLPERWARTTGLAISLALLYGALALHYGLMWPMRFNGGQGGAMDASRLGLAFVLALGVLWRGATLGSGANQEGILRSGFKLGLTVLVLTALLEIGYKISLGVRIVAIPFFASSLAGMALLTLEAEEGRQRTRWGRLLIASIGGSLGLGVLISFGVGSGASSVASQFFRVLGLIAFYISLAAFFVLEKLIRGFFSAIAAVGRIFGDPDVVRFLRPPSLLQERPGQGDVEKVTGFWAVFAEVVKWGLIALLILGILLFIYWLFKKRGRDALTDENEVRESVRGEADSDEGALIGALLPHLRPREHPALYPLPEGATSRERLFRAYFQALNTAQQRGKARRAAETPAEYAPRLAEAFPGSPAQDLSSDFAQARYGDWTPPDAEVERLEQGMRADGHKPQP